MIRPSCVCLDGPALSYVIDCWVFSGTLLLWVLITGFSFQRWRSSDFRWMLLSLQRERKLLHIDPPPRLASSPRCGLWADCKWSLNRGKFHASLHNPTEETRFLHRLYHLHTLVVMKYRMCWRVLDVFERFTSLCFSVRPTFDLILLKERFNLVNMCCAVFTVLIKILI